MEEITTSVSYFNLHFYFELVLNVQYICSDGLSLYKSVYLYEFSRPTGQIVCTDSNMFPDFMIMEHFCDDILVGNL
jgi:hypothetical protein